MAPPGLAENPGVPAGYGKSCINCSRAKCRCVLRPDGASCERCHRLRKECHQMTTQRKRTAKRASSSRTAQLEEKLDDLVSILRATQHPGQQSALPLPDPPHLPAVSSTSSYPTRLHSLATAAVTTPPFLPAGVFGLVTSGAQDSQSLAGQHRHGSCDISRQPEPTPTEAEGYLIKFRAWLKNFPFMVLPPDLTAEKLRAERPFLWLCIMNITSMSVPQQHIMRERVRQEAAQKIVISLERSMDVLLGLTCYLGWYVHEFSASIHDQTNPP